MCCWKIFYKNAKKKIYQTSHPCGWKILIFFSRSTKAFISFQLEFNGEKYFKRHNGARIVVCVIEIRNHWSFRSNGRKFKIVKKISLFSPFVHPRVRISNDKFRCYSALSLFSLFVIIFHIFLFWLSEIRQSCCCATVASGDERTTTRKKISASFPHIRENPSNLKQINYMSWWIIFFRNS